MTCVYLCHLKDRRKNVIKIYLNRRIIPQKQMHCVFSTQCICFLLFSFPSSSYQKITPLRWR